MTTFHVGQPPQAPPADPKRRWPLYAAIAAAVLLLAAGAAVAGILTARHDAPKAAASPSAAGPVRHDSPQAIAQRLADLGAPCGPLEPLTNPLGATARASCYVGDNEVVISTYASHVDVEAQWDRQSGLLAGISDVDMVLGDTWTLSADDPAYAVRAAALLGGVYRHASA